MQGIETVIDREKVNRNKRKVKILIWNCSIKSKIFPGQKVVDQFLKIGSNTYNMLNERNRSLKLLFIPVNGYVLTKLVIYATKCTKH